MIRNDVVGLTLAEIALVLLFGFLVLLLPSYARLSRELKTRSAPDLRALQMKLAEATAENERLKLENEQFRAEMATTRRHLRSEQIPSCAEINGADWLFTAVILGSDAYGVSGHQYTLQSLLQTYSGPLAEAQAEGCKQRVKVYYGKDVSLPEYYSALRQLEDYFYDKKLGAEP